MELINSPFCDKRFITLKDKKEAQLSLYIDGYNCNTDISMDNFINKIAGFDMSIKPMKIDDTCDGGEVFKKK